MTLRYVYRHVVVKKHSACRLTASIQCAVNRISSFLIYPGVSLAIKSMYLVYFSRVPLYSSKYSHMLQVSVNYSSNTLCDESTYQPYMEHQ